MYANRDIYEGTFYKNGFKNEGNYTWNYTLNMRLRYQV